MERCNFPNHFFYITCGTIEFS